MRPGDYLVRTQYQDSVQAIEVPRYLAGRGCRKTLQTAVDSKNKVSLSRNPGPCADVISHLELGWALAQDA